MLAKKVRIVCYSTVVRFAKYLLVASLMVSIGMHWVVLQSAAWVSMAVSYSVEKGSITEGLSDTFDGAHPCPLCHMVSEGTKEQTPSQDGKAPLKLDKELKLTLSLVTVPRFVFASVPAHDWIMTSDSGTTRTQQPVAPPPRVVAVG